MANPIHDPNSQVFRHMLVEARMSSGLLQADLAEKLRKTQSFVSKYERGERRLDFPEFITIADALDLDVSVFIDEYRSRIARDHPMI
ncbi:helix-turn-helix domain-containing protein [Massilia antarctica]|uniref:helix-turn-helix domain-containing protein n=1 Tax=Massilia antarctica TaxID=2765360 RepID=UPI00227044BB|nr:helix-turn-helix transcriptional regulator [Massilia sp. H27-R4]MCY0910317.1 helix-turn-helix transcriptional regulator [Massilia sp. H27-R4]